MRILGNLIWWILGGLVMSLSWFLAGVLAYISIIGIPFGRACFTIAYFTLVPFGKEPINRRELNGEDDIGTSTLGTIGNIVWFVFLGVWLAIGHIISAFFTAITIIGIPFAIQHVKLAIITIAPIGLAVLPKEVIRQKREKRVEVKERVSFEQRMKEEE